MGTCRSNRRTHPWRWRIALGAALALFIGAADAHAQTGTVSGQVVDAATGDPLSSVQITVVGTNIGTLTDANGAFRIVGVRPGRRAIMAQSIGYRPVTQNVNVLVGQVATVRFELAQSAIALSEIVVTALGVERVQRELTTSVQSMAGAELARAPEPNLVSALSGKVSGVHIISSNTPGGSARMVIRGINSLTGNNQPLWVLDGVPVSNAAGFSGTRGYNAIDYGNAIQDINPNDIASITVLKGPNATALYGSRAANGAVIITTKKGVRTGGIGITARMDVTFETPLRLPEYQNLYGQGSNGVFQATTDESWGPRLDRDTMIVQPLYGPEPAPFRAFPNNVRDFFELGRATNTNVSFTTGGEDVSVRLSISNLNNHGMLPGFKQERTSVAVNGNAGLTEQLRADASLQYVKADTRDRPAQGYGEDNAMWQFLWFGRQVDTKLLKKKRYNEDGTQYHWNSRWSNNPYWTQLEDENWDNRNRIIANGSVTYSFTPWLDLMLRAGTDMTSERRMDVYKAGSLSITSKTGAFSELSIDRQESNYDFLLNARWPGLEGWGLSGSFGGNRRDNDYHYVGAWVNELVVPNLWNLGNAAVPVSPSDYTSRSRVNSLYGTANFQFRNLWFVEATARNDWSSTLAPEHNSYFYPSLSTSLILSDLVKLPGVSYGKLRLGWAQVGNDADPYQLLDPYASDTPFGDAPRYTASNRLRNYNLKPEQTRSWEFGAEMRFFEDRFGFDVTYYNSKTFNQIVPVDISPLTGFTTKMMNAGTLANKGIELVLDATALSLDNGFRWDVSGTFGMNRNKVVELAEGIETLVLDTYYGVNVEARVGERYGAMYGRKYVRDSKGNIVVGSNGQPLNTSANPFGYLGNYNPDWTAGIRNRFSWGPFSAHVLIDGQMGGTIYSLTTYYGRRSGVLIETLQGREKGRTIAEGGGLIVKGVKVVNGDTVPNDILVDAQAYWRGLGPISESCVFDATYAKLREIRVAYQLPPAVLNRLRISSGEVAVVGRNLALWTDVPHIDPETAFHSGNVQGFEYSQQPTARTIGFSILLTP